MAVDVTKIDVWAGDITDQPGGLAKVLGPLAESGTNLDCVIARRQPDKPGTGVVFVYPVKDAKARAAAKKAGLAPVKDVWTLKAEGPNKAGVGSRMTQVLADAGISMRGVSAMTIGKKYVCYLAFDSAADAAKALRLLKRC